MNIEIVKTAIKTKAACLSTGLRYDDSFLDAYQSDDMAIEKRRAYGNSDLLTSDNVREKMPQEFKIGPFSCATNFNPHSPNFLSVENGKYVLCSDGNFLDVEFTSMPKFYSAILAGSDVPINKYATVYGGSTIGFFTVGTCFYFSDGSQCKFCSLKNARREVKGQISGYIEGEDILRSLERIIELDPGSFDKIMLNGGNLRDHDKGFENHLRSAELIRDICDRNGLTVHVITMPPNDSSLIKSTKGLFDKLVFDPEVFDQDLSKIFCPGKYHDFGLLGYEKAFSEAVEALGAYSVHSGLIAGLESLESFARACDYYSNLGVVPAVNIFHPDPGTEMQNFVRPSFDFILSATEILSQVYRSDTQRTPFLINSGRNAIDTEAYYLAKFEQNVSVN